MATEKRYNNYTISILVTTLLGVALIIPALLMHSLSVGTVPDWLFEFIEAVFGIMFVSRLVSGSSYVFRLLDRLTENTIIDFILYPFKTKKLDVENDNNQSEKLNQKIKKATKKAKQHIGQTTGNTLGFIAATAIAITTLCLKAATPTIIDHFFSAAFFLINHISNFSGLFNRSGSAYDLLMGKSKKPWYRRREINYVLGVIFGGIAGTALITVILLVVGATSAMSLGGAVPLWLSLGIVVIGTMSTGASAGGYVGRCVDFFIGKRTVVTAVLDIFTGNEPKKSIKDRVCYESFGTVIGVGIGITAATILIVAGVATLPFFGLGLPKLFAGMILMATLLSVGGGLGNRLGNMMDRFYNQGRYEHENESESESEDSVKDDYKKRFDSDHSPTSSASLVVDNSIAMHDEHSSNDADGLSKSPSMDCNLKSTNQQEDQGKQVKLKERFIAQISPVTDKKIVDVSKEDKLVGYDQIPTNAKKEKVNTFTSAKTVPLLFNNKSNQNVDKKLTKESISFVEYQRKKLNHNAMPISAKEITSLGLHKKPVIYKALSSHSSKALDEKQYQRLDIAAAAA